MKQEKKEEPRSKEQQIQFLRGPMSNIANKVNKDDPIRLSKSLNAIELLCSELANLQKVDLV